MFPNLFLSNFNTKRATQLDHTSVVISSLLSLPFVHLLHCGCTHSPTFVCPRWLPRLQTLQGMVHGHTYSTCYIQTLECDLAPQTQQSTCQVCDVAILPRPIIPDLHGTLKRNKGTTIYYTITEPFRPFSMNPANVYKCGFAPWTSPNNSNLDRTCDFSRDKPIPIHRHRKITSQGPADMILCDYHEEPVTPSTS